MTSIVKTIGENLEKNCPDNDCIIFRNLYHKHKKIKEDLHGCLLSEYSMHILESECRHISVELQRMTYENYAVVQYKKTLVKG